MGLLAFDLGLTESEKGLWAKKEGILKGGKSESHEEKQYIVIDFFKNQNYMHT